MKRYYPARNVQMRTIGCPPSQPPKRRPAALLCSILLATVSALHACYNLAMGSRKPTAKAKRIKEFRSQLGGMDDIFAREERRSEQQTAARDAAQVKKACTSKQRYVSYDEAQQTVAACAEHGTTGLHIYKCPHCNGWHLTSHPWDE